MTLAALTLLACGASPDATSGNEANLTQSGGYEFLDLAPRAYERIDSMGVALTSTALTNRDNDYQKAAPNSETYLLTFRSFLAKMHGGWRAQMKQTGFEPCSSEIFGIEAVLPCTLQRMGGLFQPKVLEVLVPDAVKLDVGKPLGFPNGRILDEQVNDLVLGMGFLKLGDGLLVRPGRCLKHEVPIKTATAADFEACHPHSFTQFGLNPPHNDKPFSKTFPYLATPHGFDDGGFWPKEAKAAK